MSKKTSSKTATKKSTKKAAPKKTAPPVATPKPGECPKGGSHEWTEEGTETYCSKCKEPKVAKSKRAAKERSAKPAKKVKLSALDAAAQVLESSEQPMNAKAMIEAMTTKGLWSSPGGKTPHATLYSAIIREISVKGKESRFKKTDRGDFAFNG
ncbi:winged helix-turn-helix domain-containing protein [Anatilimnocola floriformis]|uniref:winged helix-turn-helix domain-containing protein n=1 Tax=Anatilimnocola floriformis TaxID=2948575 RepID=UPI0020C2410A|nr:winged helix-turn-helix domain-containing protein [Anatilimnocola floriformis]